MAIGRGCQLEIFKFVWALDLCLINHNESSCRPVVARGLVLSLDNADDGHRTAAHRLGTGTFDH